MKVLPRLFLYHFFIITPLIAQVIFQKRALLDSLRSDNSSISIVVDIVALVGSTIGSVTNEQRNFLLNNIPTGPYNLWLSSPSYSPKSMLNIILRAVDSTQINDFLREETLEVDGVIISASKIVDTLSMPQTLHFLEYNEIQNSAGAFDDVNRTVAVSPGLSHLRQVRNDLLVRGAPNVNLYTIDNFEATSIIHFGIQGAGRGYVGFINFEFVESYVFSNGGFGVPYGDKVSLC